MYYIVKHDKIDCNVQSPRKLWKHSDIRVQMRAESVVLWICNRNSFSSYLQ